MTKDTKGGLKNFAAGRSDLLQIDPRIIKVDPGFNARDFSTPENAQHVEWLMSSIIENGVKEPLTVRLHQGEVILVNGESRLRAALKAIEAGNDIKTVPCQADDRYANDADRTAELITRNSGKPLTPLEQASVCKRLLNFGWAQTQIAKKIACTDSYVSHLLSLTALPEEAKAMIRSGEVSASNALSTVKADGEADGVAALKTAVEKAKASGKKKATARTIKKQKDERKFNAKEAAEIIDFIFYIQKSAESIRDARQEAERLVEKLSL